MNFNLTPVVKNLIILNVIIYLLLQFAIPAGFEYYFMLFKSNAIPFRPVHSEGFDLVFESGIPVTAFMPIQLLTHFFNHGGFMHIAFNMLALASVGPMVEVALGSKKFLSFYLFAGLVAGVLVALLDPSTIPVVGASGAIFGVFVGFALYYPNQKLSFYFIAMPSRIFVAVVGGVSLLLVVLNYLGSDIAGGISHFGHLAGIVAALIWFFIVPHLPFLSNKNGSK
jgi:membrane associated rhomboid family serine protease